MKMYDQDYLRGDRSERVDPRQAADELIAYAYWLKDHAQRENERRMPSDVEDLLSTLTDKKQGVTEVYRGFEGFQPRRALLIALKRKMSLELFLNEAEMEEALSKGHLQLPGSDA